MNEINTILATYGNEGGAVAGILAVVILLILLFKGAPNDWNK